MPSFIAGEPQPIGWAAQNGGTTEGGTTAPTLVTTLDGGLRPFFGTSTLAAKGGGLTPSGPGSTPT